jgi:hypothetical protein
MSELERGRNPRRVSVDLVAPAARAADNICRRLDAGQSYRPWFWVEGRDGVPVAVEHRSWDFGDMTGRYLEALVRVRRMAGPRARWSRAEERLRVYLAALYGPNGLVMDTDRGEPDHVFSQGSALYGLVADLEDGRRPETLALLERQVSGLVGWGHWRDDMCTWPELATAVSPCTCMAGYLITPLVRLYELTNHAGALRLAAGIARWVLREHDALGPDGEIRHPGWDGHLHAWQDTLAGLIQCSRHADVGAPRNDVVALCRRVYGWIRATHATTSGWVADSVGALTSETCAIASSIRLALELAREGHADVLPDVARAMANQLPHQQFGDVSPLGITDPLVADVVRDSFDSHATPASLLMEQQGGIEGCCTNGGVRGLWLVWSSPLRDALITLLADGNERETEEMAGGTRYRIFWHGDVVVAVEPSGGRYPIPWSAVA